MQSQRYRNEGYQRCQKPYCRDRPYCYPAGYPTSVSVKKKEFNLAKGHVEYSRNKPPTTKACLGDSIEGSRF